MIEELTRLLGDMTESATDILIGCIAQIESHNTAEMTADVKPLLFFQSEAKEQVGFAIIPDVPVNFLYAGGYFIRPKYKRGDLVWMSFATYDIAAPLAGSLADTSSSMFARENASVVCGIAGKSFSPPAGFDEDGIIIAHESGDMFFHLTQEKIKAKTALFEIEGDVKITGNAEIAGDTAVDGKIDAGMDITWMTKAVPTKASTHIHQTGVGPSSPPVQGS